MPRFLSRRTVLAAAFSAAAAAAARPARAQATKLRIGAPFSDTFGAPFYAKEAGTFAKAGFDVELSPLSNAGAVAAALAGGTLDLGIGDFVSSTNAILKGLPIQLVAGCGLYRTNEPTTQLGVKKDSPVHEPRDIEGKSITVPTLVGLTTAALKQWLTDRKVDLDRVRIVELSSPSVPAALERGTVDIGLLSEPFYTTVRNEFRIIGKPFDAIAPEFLVSAWFANRPWFEADPARAKRVVGAIYDTNRWANAHRPETLAIFADIMKRSIDELRPMVRTQYATSLSRGQIQPVIDVAAHFKLIDHAVDAETLIPKGVA